MPHKTLRLEEAEYPPLLREIPNPPQTLYLSGSLESEHPLIAIVGTRKATDKGKGTAFRFAEELVSRGFGVVSGLALGIDTAAHEGALGKRGYTVAVLGSAIDDIYPPENESLAKRILDTGGVIISEYSPGTPIQKHQFIERNRIISALSLAIIVIEAPIHSGALVTARTGAEQGKDVFVVPGPIGDPNFEGSHKLIRDGAILVGSIEDVLEDLHLT